MSILQDHHDVISMLIGQKCAVKDISDHLKTEFGSQRGFSVMSIRRYCREHGLKDYFSEEELTEAIEKTIPEVSRSGLQTNEILKLTIFHTGSL